MVVFLNLLIMILLNLIRFLNILLKSVKLLINSTRLHNKSVVELNSDMLMNLANPRLSVDNTHS